MGRFSKFFLLCALLSNGPLLFAQDWVFIEDVSGSSQGGIIIRYPDVAESRAQSLSHQLSHHGWSSLLVPIPASVAGHQDPVGTQPSTHDFNQGATRPTQSGIVNLR
jgi:hypothetical protein